MSDQPEWYSHFTNSDAQGFAGQPEVFKRAGFYRIRVRAIQGHSYRIDRGVRQQEPLPAQWFRENKILLYHATYRAYLPAICNRGLRPGQRGRPQPWEQPGQRHLNARPH